MIEQMRCLNCLFTCKMCKNKEKGIATQELPALAIAVTSTLTAVSERFVLIAVGFFFAIENKIISRATKCYISRLSVILQYNKKHCTYVLHYCYGITACGIFAIAGIIGKFTGTMS